MHYPKQTGRHHHLAISSFLYCAKPNPPRAAFSLARKSAMGSSDMLGICAQVSGGNVYVGDSENNGGGDDEGCFKIGTRSCHPRP